MSAQTLDRPPEIALDGEAPIAVIDAGSNSIRLVVYDRLSRAPIPRYNEKRLCELGAGLGRTGMLAEQPQADALAALRRFVAIARAIGCSGLHVLATAAIRRAENGRDFVARVEAATGVAVRILSGEEEARLSALGIEAGFAEPLGIMGDLGGGSVEFASVPFDEALDSVSLPIGALALRDALREGPEHARSLARGALDEAPWLDGVGHGRTLYLVGGSWRAMARARMAMVDTGVKVIHGYELDAQSAGILARTIVSMDAAELARLPGVPRRRVDLIAGAAVLLEEVLARTEPKRVCFSATGLREGRLFDLLTPGIRASDPLVAGAEQLGRESSRLRDIGPATADWTDELFGDDPRERQRLRRAACLASDTGWRDHPETRAREAFFRLVQYPFVGITHRQRVALAFAVFIRYGGSVDDQVVGRLARTLDGDDRQHTLTLGLVLELAYRISAGVPEFLKSCRLYTLDDELRLESSGPAALLEAATVEGRLQGIASALGLRRGRLTAS